MSRTVPVVLIGPPGSGCTTVGRELARVTDVPFADLGEIVAETLGTMPALALVTVPEETYREVEAITAVGLIREACAHGGVVALGSGCLNDAAVREVLGAVQAHDGRIVALTASTRCLATRNGLDAPRSVGLGNVHHEFVQRLHEREDTCRRLADVVIDTTGAQVAETVERIG